jgi:hypothetical protein
MYLIDPNQIDYAGDHGKLTRNFCPRVLQGGGSLNSLVGVGSAMRAHIFLPG